MIFNEAQYMGIPWETIIKLYREKIGKETFSTVEEYSRDFFNFLEQRSKTIISETHERRTVIGLVSSYFTDIIWEQIDETVKDKLRESSLNEQEIGAIANAVIKEHYDEWENYEKHPAFPEDFLIRFREKYLPNIREQRLRDFSGLPISLEASEQLDETAINLFYKNGRPNPLFSGVVFAGFGNNEIFPSCISYNVEMFVCKQLKYNQDFRLESSERVNGCRKCVMR